MKQYLLYVAFGFLAWVIAEYVTVWAKEGIALWVSYMPWIFVFYIAYPLLFSFFIYKMKLSNLKLLGLTFVVGFFFEIVFFGKAYMLLKLPDTIILTPLLILVYGFLTFAPKFAVSKLLPAETIK